MDESELRNSLTALHTASFAWAMTCCRHRELAEDVLQSVYLKVLEKRSQHDGRSAFRTWLFTIIRNTAIDHLRQLQHVPRKRISEIEQTRAVERNDDDLKDENELKQIRTALTDLPARQQEVAHLVFYEDLTVAEAAEVIDVTVGTARQHYARAKESLRTALAPMWREQNEQIRR